MKQQIYVFLAFFILITSRSLAQGQGNINAGGGLLFGTNIETMGVGINGQYFFTDNLAGQFGANFFFSNKETIRVYEIKSSLWTLNFNANYYFDIDNQTIRPYAIGGVNISNSRQETNFDFNEELPELSASTGTDTDFGLNLGGGADFYINDFLTPFAQIKYVISDYDQLVIMGGIRITIQ